MTLIAHYIIGLGGAAAGWIGSGWCRHTKHRVAVTLVLTFVESAISVAVIG